MPIFKSSKAATAEPAPRPPSPLSAANSLSSRSSRPSTSSTSNMPIGGRRSSSTKGPPSISSASSITGVPAPRLTPVLTPKIDTPPTSQSSRSLSSRLLRRRPSEKSSLARTPRLPALDAAASESDGPNEPLTGSTTGPDVFAAQQDGDSWAGGPIMSAAERRANEAAWGRRRSASGDSDEEAWTPASGRGVSREWSFGSSSDTPGFTSLPPPPRPGAKRSVTPQPPGDAEVVSDHMTRLALGQDFWGRRGSDLVKYSAFIESIYELPKDHPFATSYTPPVHSVSTKSSTREVRNRFGEAPPLPSLQDRRGSDFSPKRPVYRSPRSKRDARLDGLTPPPRSSSRINVAAPRSDFPNSISFVTGLTVSPSLDQPPSAPEWSATKASVRPRSNSFSAPAAAASPYDYIPVPSYLPEMSHSPVPPLQYNLHARSPKSRVSVPHLQRSGVASPSRPPRPARRAESSLTSTDETSADSDAGDRDSRLRQGALSGPYEVSTQCVKNGTGPDGEIKWEVIIRPSKGGPSTLSRAPAQLSATSSTSTISPPGIMSINLSLGVNEPSGQLSFRHVPSPITDIHTTPTRRRQAASTIRRTPSTSDAPLTQSASRAPHARGNTFGVAGARRLGMALAMDDARRSPSPAPSTDDNKLDRRITVTPPPRLQTPPPMPTNPMVTTTPTSSSKRHSRTTSIGEQRWALPAAPSTPIGSSGTPRELTYVSTPSPRGTPRRRRMVSASQLNGGLFAHGTVDDMSEEVEGYQVG